MTASFATQISNDNMRFASDSGTVVTGVARPIKQLSCCTGSIPPETRSKRQQVADAFSPQQHACDDSRSPPLSAVGMVLEASERFQ